MGFYGGVGEKEKKKKQRFEDEVKFLEVNTTRMEPINDGSYGGERCHAGVYR